jgi:hypothetical protein
MSKLYESLGLKPNEILATVFVFFFLIYQFSGAFTKLQKETVSFVMSVLLME